MKTSKRFIKKVFECVSVGLGVIALLLFSYVVDAKAMDKESVISEVPISIEVQNIPESLNQNSDVAIEVGGLFSNGCYAWKKVEIFHRSLWVHEVRAYANERHGPCTLALIPFTRVIHLGNLSEGKHQLLLYNASGGVEEEIININD